MASKPVNPIRANKLFKNHMSQSEEPVRSHSTEKMKIRQKLNLLKDISSSSDEAYSKYKTFSQKETVLQDETATKSEANTSWDSLTRWYFCEDRVYSRESFYRDDAL